MKPFNVYAHLDLNIDRGLGSYVWDKNGRSYLDFYGGHAVISIGHSHPYFIEALEKQMRQIVFYSNAVRNDLQAAMAAKLGTFSGYEDYHLFMVNSGAEAVENALKLASFKNERKKIVSFRRGFHGRTSAAVHITDNNKIIAPINRGFDKQIVSWNDLDQAASAVNRGDVCAVVIEGVQGVGGIHVPDPDFLKELAVLCKKNDTVLILDEIQSGYGRTGKFFAHQLSDVEPDLITVAKGMGNGFPMGGVLISPEFKAHYGMLGTTFGGTHLACAAGLAVLDVLESEDLLSNAEDRGNQMKKAFKGISEIIEVRGSGCMLGLELPFEVKLFRQSLLKEYGVVTGSSSDPNTLRILPPLSVSESEVELFISSFKSCLLSFKNQTDYESLAIQ